MINPHRVILVRNFWRVGTNIMIIFIVMVSILILVGFETTQKVLIHPAVAELDNNHSIKVKDQPFEISYVARDLKIISAEADTKLIQLVLEVEFSGNHGLLEITLDRDLIDSKFEGKDEEFSILHNDGYYVNFEEVNTTSKHRTLKIPLSGSYTSEKWKLYVWGSIILDGKSSQSEPIEVVDEIERPFTDEKPKPILQIPAWIKNTAGWWANEVISEDEFINAIQFFD